MPIAEAYTLDTTWSVLLCHPDTPGDNWQFPSTAEHTDPAEIHDWLSHAFGGWYADPAHHRIVRIDRTIIEEGAEA